MLSKLKKFFSNFYNIYLTFLTVLITLPVLAPILLKLGLQAPAKAIYFIYSFFCHQFAYRSIHIFDYQFAWCARDTGIWIGIWLTAILIKMKKVKGIRWYWVLPFVVPIALDGGLQTIFTLFNVSASGSLIGAPLYISNNLVRFMTGGIFGIGISLWLSPLVMEDSSVESSEVKEVKKSFFKTNLGRIFIMIAGLFVIYVGLFGIWNITSSINAPLQPLDAVVKNPTDDFLTRRADAVCPTNGFQDLFAFGCFFGD